MSKFKVFLITVVILLVAVLIGLFDIGRSQGLDEVMAPDEHSYLAKTDLVKIISPLPEVLVSNPIKVSGFARGVWFFEGSFPIQLLDADGQIVETVIAMADGEWMVEDFVPFEAKLTWPDGLSGEGSLVFRKDNPSDMRELDDWVVLPVLFSTAIADNSGRLNNSTTTVATTTPN